MTQPPDERTTLPSGSPGPLAQDERLRQELQATIAAQKELGPRYEQELIDAFLRRLDQDIDARIEQRVAQRRAPVRGAANPVAPLAASLALGIPLIAIAGGIGGLAGILAVLALIGFLNVYYDRWRA